MIQVVKTYSSERECVFALFDTNVDDYLDLKITVDYFNQMIRVRNRSEVKSTDVLAMIWNDFREQMNIDHMFSAVTFERLNVKFTESIAQYSNNNYQGGIH